MFSTIIEAVAYHAKARPDALAAVAQDEKLTYAQLYDLARGFAHMLRQSGLKRGQCVVMQAEQSLSFVVAHMGTHLAGGIFTPTERTLMAHGAEQIAAETDAHMVISRAGARWPLSMDAGEILDTAEKLARQAGDIALPDPSEPAELLFTTGTTGKSKGVLCSHRSVAAVAGNLVTGMRYSPDTLIAVPGPVSHANAIRKLSAAFLNGSAVLLLNGMTDLAAFFGALDAWPVNALCLPPSAVRMLLALSGDRLGQYAGQIDFVESGTAPLTDADKRRLCALLPNSRLYNSYGTSEAGSSCMYDYNHESAGAGCIGRPMINSRFIIVDKQRRPFDATRENPGYLACGGDVLMDGYWRDSELTARTVENGFIYTSDLAYWGPDGMIYVLGREDDVINVGGRKVAPDEVERAALEIGGVMDCGCARMKDPLSGEAVRLFVVMKPGAKFDAVALRRALAERLADYMVPRVIVERDSLPRASNGKLKRNRLE